VAPMYAIKSVLRVIKLKIDYFEAPIALQVVYCFG